MPSAVAHADSKSANDVRGDAFQAALESVVEGDVRFDLVSRGLYSTDASVYQIIPRCVVVPKTRDDVVRTLAICREHSVPITARGGGTSQAGQAVGEGVQLDFSKHLNRLLELNPDRKTVRVEPGIVLDELNAFLKPYQLQLPLDLSTSNRATIGGMIANNSSGTRSVVYGKTLNYVEELTVLLADGSVVHMRPVDCNVVDAKCGQDDAEGNCYRTVKCLSTDLADEIERRYPKLMRRVGGYNLDEFVPGKEPFNLAQLIVGSEGTLGLVLEATLRVVPLPQAAVVCVVHFEDLLEALAAVPAILAHAPSAIELMDRLILDSTKGKTEFEPLRDFISGDPAAVLVVEFQGDARDELSHRLDRLTDGLEQGAIGYHVHRAVKPAAQTRVWTLRRAALGLSMSMRGDAKAISFVEDTAVAPERLRDYIERFLAVLAEHDTQAGFYAHASVGLLHIRPVVNLKTADGVETFEQIAGKIAELVLEFGGALSGEHGDGLVRAPFQRKMFGDGLYDAFCQIKRAFDPQNIFNPGKIVHAPELTENLRFGPNYQPQPVETKFDFSDFGDMLRAAEQCGGVGACRKPLSGTMCPSYMATRDEADSTRGRANALRLAMSGQLGPHGLTDAELDGVFDLCLECKACKSECPTGVDMARLKAEFLHQQHRRHGTPRRSRLLANVASQAEWGSRFAPLSNWLLASGWMRWWAEQRYGLDRRRRPPQFARTTFLHWWRRHSRERRHFVAEADRQRPQVAVFADTFTNHFEPRHAIAAVRFAEHVGHDVIVPDRVCCGRPLISKGLLDEAARQAELTTRQLLPLAERGTPIVFCEPSCYSAVVDDHPNLLRGELQVQSRRVAEVCRTFERWAVEALDASSLLATGAAPRRTGPKEVFLHGHCHQKAIDGIAASVQLLSRIPDAKVVDLDAGCCGMAGSFGYEREHYKVSQAIGERKLFPAVRRRSNGAVVVASGFSCRHQIRHFTNVDAVSPPELLLSLLNMT